MSTHECGGPRWIRGTRHGFAIIRRGFWVELAARVTFHNPENGSGVLRVKARGQRDLVTTLGHAAKISAGEWITASGIWLNDRNHGLQFKAHFLKPSAPA